jgi:hypothetical protein
VELGGEAREAEDEEEEETGRLLSSSVKVKSKLKAPSGRKFFNATKKSLKEDHLPMKGKIQQTTTGKGNVNQNNNSNRKSTSDTYLDVKESNGHVATMKFYSQCLLNKSAKKTGIKLDAQKAIHLDDSLLLELNKNFSHFLETNLVNARLALAYHRQSNWIEIKLDSIENVSTRECYHVRALVDVFYRGRHSKQMKSTSVIERLKQDSGQVSFPFRFAVHLSERVKVRLVRLNVIIIGRLIDQPANEAPPTLQSLVVLTSDTSTANVQILGGVQIKIKDYLNQITHDD